MLLDQKTNGWTYLFEGGPIARPQRYACLHGGPTYQVIMHTTLQFYTDLCSISDRSLDPVEVVNIERQIGDWECWQPAKVAHFETREIMGWMEVWRAP